MSSSESESVTPRRGAKKKTKDIVKDRVKQTKDDAKAVTKAFVRQHKARASIKLADSYPPLKKKKLRAIIQDLIPSVGNHLYGGTSWTPDMIDRAESKYIDTNPIINNQDEQKPDGGLMLYRTCLRLWHMLPTQIVTPVNGLVFKGKGDGNFLNDPMQLRLKWSAIFNERLTSLLIHPAWDGKLYYLLTALAFASMCESDDRRLWITNVHEDSFFDTWNLCQVSHREKSKSAILNEVKLSLETKGIWPNQICQVLQAIASRTSMGLASADNDEAEEEEESSDERKPELQSLIAISANHLLHIQSALDYMTDPKGMPIWHATKDYYHLFTASRDGGTYKPSDCPKSKGYHDLLKQARIGLLYDAYAYKVVWEKEGVALRCVTKDDILQGDREAIGEDQGEDETRPSQRRSNRRKDSGATPRAPEPQSQDQPTKDSASQHLASTHSSSAIALQRKRPGDTLTEESTTKRPQRGTHRRFSGDIPVLPANESRGTVNRNDQLKSSDPLGVNTPIKVEEDIQSGDGDNDNYARHYAAPHAPYTPNNDAAARYHAAANTTPHRDVKCEIRARLPITRSVTNKRITQLSTGPQPPLSTPISKASSKKIEQELKSIIPVVRNRNVRAPMGSPISYVESRYNPSRIGHRRQGAEYENVNPERAALIRQSNEELQGRNETNRRGTRPIGFSRPLHGPPAV